MSFLSKYKKKFDRFRDAGTVVSGVSDAIFASINASFRRKAHTSRMGGVESSSDHTSKMSALDSISKISKLRDRDTSIDIASGKNIGAKRRLLSKIAANNNLLMS